MLDDRLVGFSVQLSCAGNIEVSSEVRAISLSHFFLPTTSYCQMFHRVRTALMQETATPGSFGSFTTCALGKHYDKWFTVMAHYDDQVEEHQVVQHNGKVLRAYLGILFRWVVLSYNRTVQYREGQTKTAV